jgi:hypothetical protein
MFLSAIDINHKKTVHNTVYIAIISKYSIRSFFCRITKTASSNIKKIAGLIAI